MTPNAARIRRIAIQDERWANTVMRAKARAEYADLLVIITAKSVLRDAERGSNGSMAASGRRVLARFLRERAEAYGYLNEVREARWL